MTERSIAFSTWVLERTYDASPARVFAAWADPKAKTAWMVGPSEDTDHTLDFRVGGGEHLSGGPEGGPIYTYDTVIQDIVPDERIIATEVMHMDGKRISVTIATIELQPIGDKTRLVLTEQGGYLDGLDTSEAREHGTGELLDALGVYLSKETASA
jgi:uncharacterized protein YndB with AHSA1/START domain